MKDNGTIYFMVATQYMPIFDVYIQEKYNVLARIVWSYDSSGYQSKRMFGSLYEPILMTNKNKKFHYTFNVDDILIETEAGKKGLINYRKDPPQPYNTHKVPGNVWSIPRVRYRMEEYENHPTKKPEKLIERIILTSSNKGEIVLDPFGGSFSTAAVALKLERKVISFDINEEFYKIGIRRTGLATTYKGEKLYKKKERKTSNLSKKNRNLEEARN